MRSSATRSRRASHPAPVPSVAGRAAVAARAVRARIGDSRRTAQLGLAAAAAVGVAGLITTSVLAPGSPASARNEDAYGTPSIRCVIRDPRLAQASGLAVVGGQLYAISDSGPIAVYALDEACRIATAVKLRVPLPADPMASLAASPPIGMAAVGPRRLSDVEDLAAAPDGALWLADIGGNTVRRSAVSLYRWPGTGDTASRYDLRYPDGAHDAEAILISLTGQPFLVTKAADGHSGVYAAPRTLAPAGPLAKVTTLDLRRLRAPGDTAPGSLLVTGGAVAPDGVHFVLRTYTAAYEWDAPDGDIERAIRFSPPRVIALAKDRQGEAIAYGSGGTRLLTAGEGTAEPVRELEIRRPALQLTSAAPVLSTSTIVGSGVAALLAATIILVGRDRRRWSKRATTYETGS
jgi:hypothetical protein